MTSSEFSTIRTQLGFSKVRLAKELDVHVTTVSRWERGLRKIPKPVARLILTLKTEGVRTPPKSDMPVVADRDTE